MHHNKFLSPFRFLRRFLSSFISPSSACFYSNQKVRSIILSEPLFFEKVTMSCTWAQPLIAAFEPSLSFISLSCPRILCFTPMMATSYQEHVISRTSCKGFPTIGRIWGPISPAHFPSSFLVRDSEIRLNSCICLIS